MNKATFIALALISLLLVAAVVEHQSSTRAAAEQARLAAAGGDGDVLTQERFEDLFKTGTIGEFTDAVYSLRRESESNLSAWAWARFRSGDNANPTLSDTRRYAILASVPGMEFPARSHWGRPIVFLSYATFEAPAVNNAAYTPIEPMLDRVAFQAFVDQGAKADDRDPLEQNLLEYLLGRQGANANPDDVLFLLEQGLTIGYGFQLWSGETTLRQLLDDMGDKAAPVRAYLARTDWAESVMDCDAECACDRMKGTQSVGNSVKVVEAGQ